jgi:hypothetical protein
MEVYPMNEHTLRMHVRAFATLYVPNGKSMKRTARGRIMYRSGMGYYIDNRPIEDDSVLDIDVTKRRFKINFSKKFLKTGGLD